MKGMVVEIKGKNMVVVDETGNFKKMKYEDGCRIGQEIDLQPDSNIRYFPMMYRIAAVAAIFIMAIGLSAYGYYSPYSYVSVDINPSVEIVLNRFEKVLDVQPLNEDGEKIVDDSYGFMHKKVDYVISKLIDEAYKENYLKDNQDNEVFITVSAPKAQVSEEVSREVEEYAIAELKNSNIKAHVSAEGVTIEKRVLAKKESISVGKFVLLEQLQQISPDTGVEQVKDKSVKDIIENIKTEKEKDKEKDKHKDKDISIEKEEKKDSKDENEKKVEKEEKNKDEKKKENKKKDSNEKNEDKDIKKDSERQQEDDKWSGKKDDTSGKIDVSLPQEKIIQEQSSVQEDLYEKENSGKNKDEGIGKEKDEDKDKNEKYEDKNEKNQIKKDKL